ncbi:guanine nucleotide-binding protein subunit beta-like protein 1 isoform X2 [Monodelphis domestica]|uniref:guanine nucleotide-binding protein subunit beta-like protein 1 isoform X2 n=1 Tax=Monodelphis domestica TaxID=13616 RepID=UPI00044340FE|nr:guanine nucleotide-binding protein subunit beta-like protein 1 isoform X2 [Monodelphis domestica]XP_056677379.1 guanine nucleotide-binding protein subunit beta-like protein 1 isoform X2 [Monodelphis domestica]XP_056677380.1 guanine nucleotide-binding protein subunit beta-like protein 1 isoform X2 [Monodelphis domestica]
MALPPPPPQFVLRGTQSAVNSLHFSCRSQAQSPPLLFSGSLSGLVHVWNLHTRRVDATLDGHGGQSVYWVKTLGDQRLLLSQGRDLKLCLWDLAEGRRAPVDSLSLDSVGFCQGSVLRGGAQECWLLAVPGRGTEEPASSSHPLLLAGYEDGSVILWNVSERRMLSRLSCHKEPVMSLDFDSRKAKGVSGSSEKALCVWGLDEQQNLKVCRTQELTNPGIADVVIRPDGKILATAGWDHRIRLFGWKQLKPLAVLDYHSAAVHCVAFSDPGQPREQLLAGGSKDQRISVWSVYNQS